MLNCFPLRAVLLGPSKEPWKAGRGPPQLQPLTEKRLGHIHQFPVVGCNCLHFCTTPIYWLSSQGESIEVKKKKKSTHSKCLRCDCIHMQRLCIHWRWNQNKPSTYDSRHRRHLHLLSYHIQHMLNFWFTRHDQPISWFSFFRPCCYKSSGFIWGLNVESIIFSHHFPLIASLMTS